MKPELKEYLKSIIKNKHYLLVLQHLKKANVDYGKSIMLNTKIPIQEIVNILDKLEKLGLIERVEGATLKNTEAKFKLSSETHKHHTYYTLTRIGDHLLRHMTERDLIKAYIEYLKLDELAMKIMKLAEELNADHALTYAKLTKHKLEEVNEKLEHLVKMGLLEEKNSKIIKFKNRKSKPKKETRTHHKYYGLTKIGELVVREMKRENIIPQVTTDPFVPRCSFSLVYVYSSHLGTFSSPTASLVAQLPLLWVHWALGPTARDPGESG